MPVKRTGTLSRYFRRDQVADVVADLPKPVTPYLDMFFPVSQRKQKHSTIVSIEEITAETGAVPLVVRGSRSYPVDPQGKGLKFIEPDGIILSRFLSAKEINDLISAGDEESLKAWTEENIEFLRDRVSETTETLVRQAFTGKIAYPTASDGSITGSMEIDLGTPNALSAATLKKADGIAGVQTYLERLLSAHRSKAGSGGLPRIFMGSAVYAAVVSVVAALQNAPAVWTDYGIKLFGKYEVAAMDDTYTLPGSQTPSAMLAANKVRVVDMANAGKLIYTALDDLDANLAPMPFYCKPVEKTDPDGIKLVASSKPLPCFAMKRMSEQTVTVS